MTIEYIKGDLFAANERAIAHGCNCHGVMGAGVARIVAERFPEAFREYRRSYDFKTYYPGCAQPVQCFEDPLHRDGEVTTIYNLATQNAPGANAKIDFVKAALQNMRRHMEFVGNDRVAMPKIGAGIGGLNWGITEQVITEVFNLGGVHSFHITVYEL